MRKLKYLGFWFTTKNQYSTNIKKASGKTQQLVNKVWGETERAGVTDLRRRLFLMDSTVKAAAMYGVELWGWERHDTIEKIQGRFPSASMGLSRDTPNYIWKLEARKRSIAVEVLRRAGNFVLRIYRMKENRWPRKYLTEEIRALKNDNLYNWGKQLEKALKELGDGLVIKKLWEKRPAREIESRLKELWKIREDQDIQRDWGKLEKSTYFNYYKGIKESVAIEAYWRRKNLKGWQNESWARWRCGKNFNPN